ncbi:MAG: hypothetical protein WC055_01440 [Melioribacteraceae bacterium]
MNIAKYVLMILVLQISNLFCQQDKVKSFTELLDNLNSGEIARVIIHYNKCKLYIDGEEKNAPEAIGGMDLKTFEYFAIGSIANDKQIITSSHTVLISHPRYGYVLNYVKIRLYDDNSVEIIARYLDPKTYEIKMDETFLSVIDDGLNNGGINIFIN